LFQPGIAKSLVSSLAVKRLLVIVFISVSIFVLLVFSLFEFNTLIQIPANNISIAKTTISSTNEKAFLLSLIKFVPFLIKKIN
jgi:hypothetical protein